jgi:hypothetical protein
VPLGLASFAAVLCAGPGAIAVPYTAQLAEPLICPPHSTLLRDEHPGTDSDGNTVTYISLSCVGDNNFRQAVDGRAFVVLGGTYFVVFSAAALAVSFLIGRTARGGPLPRPLGREGLRQVEALLDQKRKIDAIRLVQKHTGANLRQAKDYVETLATPPPGVATPSTSGAPQLSPDATAELARLKAQLQAGQITVEEFKARAAEIALRL